LICFHNNIKHDCKECKGKNICEHNKIKYYCKDCNGKSICEHKKQKKLCKICVGSSICDHGKQKNYCKDCNGSGICEHLIQKNFCKKCNGKNICKHDRQKYYCRDCKGKGICKHDKKKEYCKECGGSQICKTFMCESVKKRGYNEYCYRCFVHIFPDNKKSRNYKTKEKTVCDYLSKEFYDKTIILDKKIDDGCSKRRPDLLIDLGYQVIIVEIDENQHKNYDTSCENKRLMEISKDLAHRPIIFIRFNPDDYQTKENKKITSCWNINKLSGLCYIKKSKENEWIKRIKLLKETIDQWIIKTSEKTIEIVKLFYNEEPECKKEDMIEHIYYD
jgi:hypothetical protein